MLWGFFTGRPLSIESNICQTAYPRWLNTGEPHIYIANHRPVERYENFIDACLERRATKICFFRTYAMGDILMLLPIVRALRRELNLERVKIVCRAGFWESLRTWDSQPDFEFWRWDQRTFDYDCDIHMDLDSCLECDHWGGDESAMHRLELYGKALGVEVKYEL